jgi:hypothetical protein
MAVTVSTYNLTITRLEPDGVNGYWWATKDSNSNLNKMSWATASEPTETAGTVIYADSFFSIMQALQGASVTLADLEFNINLDSRIEQQNLNSQFQSPALTNANVDTLAGWYNPVRLCKYLGVFALVRRMFNRSHLTFAQLETVLIYLGKRGKVDKPRVETLMNNQLAAGEITQAEYDQFWINWNLEV